MEKKFQVFISSTYLDLKEERQKVVEAVLNAGHIPAGMELFHAGDETQKELIEEWIEDSDIYVLILGGRYGSLDTDGKGYTHWEYDKAKELGKPRFSLVLTKDYLNQKVKDGKIEATDLEFSHPKLAEFRAEVRNKIVSHIENIDQIEAAVIKSINRIIKKQSGELEGWVKGNILNELKSAQEEIDDLRERLDTSRREVIQKSDKIISFQTQKEKLPTGNIPEDVSQMIRHITASKDEDEILRSEMKWITEYMVKFGKENRPENPNPDNTVSGGYDGKYGLATLQVGKNQLSINADYQTSTIKFNQFLRDYQGALTHSVLTDFYLDEDLIYRNDDGNKLDEKEIIYWIRIFLKNISSSKHV